MNAGKFGMDYKYQDLLVLEQVIPFQNEYVGYLCQ